MKKLNIFCLILLTFKYQQYFVGETPPISINECEATNEQRDNIFLHMQSKLGEGTNGKIFGDDYFAVKEISIGYPHEEGDINKEIRVMSSFEAHYDVASIEKEGCYFDGYKLPFTVNLLMPKMEFNFDEYIIALQRSHLITLPEITIMKIDLLLKIALGLSKFHSFGIGHYDFKGQNILMMNQTTPVLTDFQFTRFHTKHSGLFVQGSPKYLGELVTAMRQLQSFNDKDDLYAFGIVILETLTDVHFSKYYDMNDLRDNKDHELINPIYSILYKLFRIRKYPQQQQEMEKVTISKQKNSFLEKLKKIQLQEQTNKHGQSITFLNNYYKSKNLAYNQASEILKTYKLEVSEDINIYHVIFGLLKLMNLQIKKLGKTVLNNYFDIENQIWQESQNFQTFRKLRQLKQEQKQRKAIYENFEFSPQKTLEFIMENYQFSSAEKSFYKREKEFISEKKFTQSKQSRQLFNKHYAKKLEKQNNKFLNDFQNYIEQYKEIDEEIDSYINDIAKGLVQIQVNEHEIYQKQQVPKFDSMKTTKSNEYLESLKDQFNDRDFDESQKNFFTSRISWNVEDVDLEYSKTATNFEREDDNEMELEDYEEEIEESIDYKFEKYSEKILI